MFNFCPVARTHEKAHDLFPLTVESKEVTFAVVSTSAEAQLRKRDMKAFVTTPDPTHTPKEDSLDRKSSKGTLEDYDEDAEV